MTKIHNFAFIHIYAYDFKPASLLASRQKNAVHFYSLLQFYNWWSQLETADKADCRFLQKQKPLTIMLLIPQIPYNNNISSDFMMRERTLLAELCWESNLLWEQHKNWSSYLKSFCIQSGVDPRIEKRSKSHFPRKYFHFWWVDTS